MHLKYYTKDKFTVDESRNTTTQIYAFNLQKQTVTVNIMINETLIRIILRVVPAKDVLAFSNAVKIHANKNSNWDNSTDVN
jgi:hypothetical protein